MATLGSDLGQSLLFKVFVCTSVEDKLLIFLGLSSMYQPAVLQRFH